MLDSRRYLGSKVSMVLLMTLLLSWPAQPQEPVDPDEAVTERVDIEPAASDAEIADRLTRIFEATGWFENVAVRVDSGVAFLNAQTDDADRRDWAERLASSTQDVTAVVNSIEVEGAAVWDLSPAWEQMRMLGNAAVRHSPLVVLALMLLAITWFVAGWAARVSQALLSRHLPSKLLRDVATRAIAVPVFIIGLYLVLRISGLTGLAVTVVGSTGLLGLILGFAFRDIAENFLASILISMNRPFATGDRIEVSGYEGFVQSVNTRSTLLMTLDGNHVQIPNATIYKGTITNFTANPNARFSFPIGIGYEDSIAEAQRVGLAVLRAHPAVIDDPEPLVLVEALGAATINLRVYFWIDISKHSHYKVQSAVIRQTKAAFEQAGISMPDEAREVIFPKGVPVQMLREHDGGHADVTASAAGAVDDESGAGAEGDYASEAEDIERQAREARAPEGGENLLKP